VNETDIVKEVNSMSDGVKNANKPIQRANTQILRRTLFLLAVCGIAAFAMLVARLYQVQIVNHEFYERRALAQQLGQTTITASRGTIFDRNGNTLAISASVENVFISPREMMERGEDPELIADGLSAILGVSREMILERAANTQSQYQTIKRQVEAEEAALVRAFISEHRIRGVHLEPATRRYYPNSSLASQVLGFVGTDNIGLDGLEQRYERYLAGVDGRVVRLRNARQTDMLFANYEDYFDAQNGNNITLTIDTTIQYIVEKHLTQAIADYGVQNGAAAIVMNARTGEILAIVSYPNFDPNDFLAINSELERERLALITDDDERAVEHRAAQDRQWRNKALSDTYEPGSVFKIVTFAMALEENLVSLESRFHCGGAMNVLGRGTPLHCHRRTGHGSLSLSEAMQRSCNVATVNIGQQVGAQMFYRYAEAFGLFDRTGLDNSAEGRSIWWEESVFFNGNNLSQLASASFGQTFKITPIQMITAVAASVNGGYLMQPYIVSQITDASGNIIEAREPTVVRQVVSAETSAIMRQMLEATVTNGTGRNAQVPGFRIGGKTGTSENIEALVRGDEGGETARIASFVGVAPADDPEIAILVLLDTPSHNTGITVGGGTMAAPVVGRMMEDILPHLEIQSQLTDEERMDRNVSVPRLIGRSVEEASELLERHGFDFDLVGESDTVTWQLPVSNALVASGTRVTLYLGAETPRDREELVTVPDLSGMPYPRAREALEQRGLFIRTVGVPKSDSRAIVSIQSVAAGLQTSYGTIVEVTLIDRESTEMQLET